MAKPEETKKKPAVPAATAQNEPPVVSDKPPVEAAETKRGTAKKALVLNISFNVKLPVTLKKGKRLEIRSADYYLVSQSNPELLKKISETVYELTDDATITKKTRLPVGTILDPKEDAWIIERIQRKHTEEAGALKEIDIA
jgi:hypothetical protein